MGRIAKKLTQSVISTSMTAVYTVPSNTITQITEIWFSNTSETYERKISLAVHGTGTANIIVKELILPPKGGQVLSECKLVLSASEVLAAQVDTGSDVNISAYGIEEA